MISTNSLEEDDERDRYVLQQEGCERLAKGRNIAIILFERSIRGCAGIGGIRFLTGSKDMDRRSNSIGNPTTTTTTTTAGENMTTNSTAEEGGEEPSITDTLCGNCIGMSSDMEDVNEYNGSNTTTNEKKDISAFDLQQEVEKLLQNRKKHSDHIATATVLANNKYSSGTHLNSYPCKVSNEIQNYGERYSVTKFQSSYVSLKEEEDNSAVVSTISVAFSHDGRVLASTHGDHTVKITCCHSGRLLRSLEGHPRTPWTVKFHPTNSLIVASGCLGFQVRVWNWNYLQQSGNYKNNSSTSEDYAHDTSNRIGVCLHMIRLQNAIISLAFHPTASLIAAASGTNLVLWDYNEYSTDSDSNNGLDSTNKNNGTSTESDKAPKAKTFPVVEIRHESALRCVHFPPNGNTIIVGGVDPTDGGLPAATIFSLRLYDFDIHQALRRRTTRTSDQSVLSNCRLLVHRALLYNDGGFDVSPCGKYLCACAEYWLPTDVNCATDLFPKDDLSHNEDSEDLDTATNNSNQTTNACIIDKEQDEDCVVLSTSIQPSNSSSTTDSRATMELPNATEASTSASTAGDGGTTPFRRRARFSRYPVTPPISYRQYIPLSPPPPPGRRLPGGLDTLNNNNSNNPTNSTNFQMRRHHDQQQYRQALSGNTTSFPRSSSSHISPAAGSIVEGRVVPHVVIVNLAPSKLGQLLEAAPLDTRKASGVTCVKFSPSAEYCLLGYGVRESVDNNNGSSSPLPHTVTAVYRIRGGMTHVSTMMSLDDDVNIARFHPYSGHGFVYGTKQGKLRIMAPKPWNYFSS